jgi:hypothetical protein
MGTYDPERGCYEVIERDAHSWPEVYFSGYGWVPFEPTAPFRAFERPPDGMPQPERADIPAMPRRPWSLTLRAWWRDARVEWTTYAAMAAFAVALALAIAVWVRRRRRVRWTTVEAIAAYYAEMSRLGERLGRPRLPHDTPAEYGVRLIGAIRARTTRWPWRGRRLPAIVREAGGHVLALSRAYERASYGPHTLHEAHRSDADRRWRRLERQMWWLWLASRAGSLSPLEPCPAKDAPPGR